MAVSIFNVGEVYIPADLQLFAVGWIEEAGFTTGAVPEESIEAFAPNSRHVKGNHENQL